MRVITPPEDLDDWSGRSKVTDREITMLLAREIGEAGKRWCECRKKRGKNGKKGRWRLERMVE